jgi:tetratricopeptide (TPR) repeat protein
LSIALDQTLGRGQLSQPRHESARPPSGRGPGAVSPEQYRRGLRLAEKVCRLQPDNQLFLTTLGAAQYRVGQYRQALATLARAEQIYQKLIAGLPAVQLSSRYFRVPRLQNLAFLAMVHQRLGEPKLAADCLRRLRDANQPETRPLLEEAAGLIEGAVPER